VSSAQCGGVANVIVNSVVFAMPDKAPAAWQLVAENTSSVLDVLAFR